jgi:hypothetical protein
MRPCLQLQGFSLLSQLLYFVPLCVATPSEYPIWSPYDATEAANILMQMIQDDQEASTHA